MQMLEMGCNTSSTDPLTTDYYRDAEDSNAGRTRTDANIGLRPTETILQAFQRLDEATCTLEQTCPGPRLATAEAWIEHLETIETEATKSEDTFQNQLQTSHMFNETEIEMLDMQDNVKPMNKKDMEHEDITKLATQLGIAFDVEKAAKHEEFVAKVCRSIMKIISHQLRKEMVEHSQKRAMVLTESYNQLKILYAEQDDLISYVTGGNYNSQLEDKLDMELETARQVRDKLGSVAEQWRTSGALLRASTKAAIQSVESWRLVSVSKIDNERISLALDCQHYILSSLLGFEGAQSALPQVEIPFVTPRQASAVRHANVYLLTDMANVARYQHTKEVFEGYEKNINKAMEWLQETYKKTLKKDLDDAEDAVLTIAKQLRHERVKSFSELVGNRLYNPNLNDIR